MKPSLKRIWFIDERPVHSNVEIRIDWDNDRHHAVFVEPPFDNIEVISALIQAKYLISTDPHLEKST